MRIDDYSAVVWDFNGTLLDDVDCGIAAVNAMLARRGMKTLASRDEYFAVFGFPISEYYRRLGFDFSRESYEILAHEWVAEYNLREPYTGIRAGALSLLQRIAAAGIPNLLLSATESEMLRAQLRRLGIEQAFSRIIGRGDIYASGKLAQAESLGREARGRLLFIGDTGHDLEAARAAGGDCILVSGGHSSEFDLARLSAEVVPDFECLEVKLFAPDA